MIFHPAILALLIASALSCVILVGSAGFAVQVLRGWDIASGRNAQLVMERRTYLVSTLLSFVMVAELLSLLLFVFNADKMASQFVGAMCAVGTLNANAYGFPALMVKMGVFFLAATWLIVNHVDSRGYDYPLIRFKYALLVLIAPVVIAAAVLQGLYFWNLDADVMTSCCSKLFTSESEGVSAEMAGLDERMALYMLYGVLVLVVAVGSVVLKTGRGGMLYAVASIVMFCAAITAIVSVVSLYVYEHPHHHCPFCLLKPEYGYFGYLLYVPLFFGTALGMGVGPITAFRGAASLQAVIPTVSRSFVQASLMAFAVFAMAASYAIVSSNLRLFAG